VTPGENGIALDLGAGDTALHAGAGPGGVTVTRGSRSSSPASPNAPDSTPVRIPTLRPGLRTPSSLAGSGGGAGGTIFGPSATPTANGAPPASRRSSVADLPARFPSAVTRPEGPSAKDENRRSLPPFFEIVEQIPAGIAAALVALGLIALALWFAWARNRRRLAGNAFVDPVAGIANAAAFERMLEGELDRATRYKRPLGLLLVDVSEPDREDGRILRLRDTTLREASDAISERIREADMVALLGHDRFGVICPEATAVSTETLARALERRLEELRIHVKIGVVERQGTDETAADLLARAEAAVSAEQPAAPGPPERMLRVA
jgi:diguanylate cyclase (GGDEF)-like protein